MAAEKFTFPDEKGVDGPGKKDELKIEVIDDTPPEDKNRAPLPEKIVKELDDDDLTTYSEQVQQRMKTLKKAFHDERRAKEQATREREEAVKFAQTQYETVNQLKQRLSTGEKIFVKEVSAAADTQIEAARSELKRAYEAGDAGLIAKAQEALTDAKLKQREIEGFKNTTGQAEGNGVERQSPAPASQPQPAPPPDPKAEAWKKNNGWFGVDPEMTALALGLHEKVIKDGVNPGSDDYYKRIDTTMRKRFPEYFTEDQKTDPEPPARTATVVAPATRSTAPRQVRLTASQVAIAKRLGLTNEAYAREVMKLEEANRG